MRNLSWRTKLMGLFTLVLGASLLFQMFYVIPTIRNREVETTRAYQEEIARNIAWEMDNNLKRFKARLMEVAGLPAFRSMDVINQRQIMVANVEATPLINSLFVMDAAGWFVSGSVSADDLAAYTTENYADQPYFTVPFEQGQAYFAPPRFYPNQGIVSISVSVPIESETGDRVGVLIGGMELNDCVMERVADYPLEEEMVAYVIDREGTVIAHSGMDLFALEEGPLSLDFSDRPLVQAIMDREIGESQEHEHEGTPHFCTSAILESYLLKNLGRV